MKMGHGEQNTWGKKKTIQRGKRQYRRREERGTYTEIYTKTYIHSERKDLHGGAGRPKLQSFIEQMGFIPIHSLEILMICSS